MKVCKGNFSVKHISAGGGSFTLNHAPHALYAATYYVANDGKDANPGSELMPFQTIQRGFVR